MSRVLLDFPLAIMAMAMENHLLRFFCNATGDLQLPSVFLWHFFAPQIPIVYHNCPFWDRHNLGVSEPFSDTPTFHIVGTLFSTRSYSIDDFLINIPLFSSNLSHIPWYPVIFPFFFHQDNHSSQDGAPQLKVVYKPHAYYSYIYQKP